MQQGGAPTTAGQDHGEGIRSVRETGYQWSIEQRCDDWPLEKSPFQELRDSSSLIVATLYYDLYLSFGKLDRSGNSLVHPVALPATTGALDRLQIIHPRLRTYIRRSGSAAAPGSRKAKKYDQALPPAQTFHI
jgi:hypothetical protein